MFFNIHQSPSPVTNRLYYVHCKTHPSVTTDSSDLLTVVGDYSRKIEKIVQTVLQLKRDEPSVKIIIFSDWINILGVIADALRENNIIHRLKSSVFNKSLDDFKVN